LREFRVSREAEQGGRKKETAGVVGTVTGLSWQESYTYPERGQVQEERRSNRELGGMTNAKSYGGKRR